MGGHGRNTFTPRRALSGLGIAFPRLGNALSGLGIAFLRLGNALSGLEGTDLSLDLKYKRAF